MAAAYTDEDDLEVGEHDVRVLLGFGLSIELPPLSTVALVEAPGGISLGDAYAVALADATDATLVVGADPEFEDLPVDVDVLRVREDPV